MKRYMILMLALILCACSQDKGNYDYHDLKEPKVDVLEDASVLMFSQLNISSGLGEGEWPDEKYSFEWKVLDVNSNAEAIVLGEERNLDYEVTLTPGSYTLFFTVTEKSSRVMG